MCALSESPAKCEKQKASTRLDPEDARLCCRFQAQCVCYHAPLQTSRVYKKNLPEHHVINPDRNFRGRNGIGSVGRSSTSRLGRSSSLSTSKNRYTIDDMRPKWVEKMEIRLQSSKKGLHATVRRDYELLKVRDQRATQPRVEKNDPRVLGSTIQLFPAVIWMSTLWKESAVLPRTS